MIKNIYKELKKELGEPSSQEVYMLRDGKISITNKIELPKTEYKNYNVYSEDFDMNNLVDTTILFDDIFFVDELLQSGYESDDMVGLQVNNHVDYDGSSVSENILRYIAKQTCIDKECSKGRCNYYTDFILTEPLLNQYFQKLKILKVIDYLY